MTATTPLLAADPLVRPGDGQSLAYPISTADARRRAVGAASRRRAARSRRRRALGQPRRRNHRRRPDRQGLGHPTAGQTVPRSQRRSRRVIGFRTAMPDTRVRRPASTTTIRPPTSCSRCPRTPPRCRSCRRPGTRLRNPSGSTAHHRRRSRSRTTNRRRAMVVGRVVAALLAVLRAGDDRCSLAVAVDEEPQPEQGRRHWTSNSRDIVDPNAQFGDENFLIVGVDSRIGQNSDMGAGTTDDAAGARSDTDHAGQHPGQPQTRCGRVVSTRPRDHADPVRTMESRRPVQYGPLTDEESPSATASTRSTPRPS